MDNENVFAIGLVIILVVFFIGAELYYNVFRTDNTIVNNNQIVNYCPYCGHKLNKIRGGNYEDYRK